MDNKFHTVRGYELKHYNENEITPAMEDYIEMIYRNSLEKEYIRINELSKLLNVKDSSATKMVQKLTSFKLLNYEKYGIITLTDKGKEIGKFLLKRHNIIEKFLCFIGCKENILLQTELIEHNISNETVDKIDCLFNFFEKDIDVLKKYEKFKNK